MMFKHKEHRVPGLNTTSTADISFMLLIFFLVTTNMDIDKGLQRQLPPTGKNDMQESFVEKGTTMQLVINADNQLLLDGKPFPVNRLRAEVENFVQRVGKRHLITVKVDPGSNYDTYFGMQNELMAAYRVLRDRTALRLYGRDYNALSQTQRDKVKDECPQRIAEQYNGSIGQDDSANGATNTASSDEAENEKGGTE